jgi:hypothetical protein
MKQLTIYKTNECSKIWINDMWVPELDLTTKKTNGFIIDITHLQGQLMPYKFDVAYNKVIRFRFNIHNWYKHMDEKFNLYENDDPYINFLESLESNYNMNLWSIWMKNKKGEDVDVINYIKSKTDSNVTGHILYKYLNNYNIFDKVIDEGLIFESKYLLFNERELLELKREDIIKNREKKIREILKP